MDDIRLDAGFFEHPKTKRLKRRFGDAGVIALIKLLIYTSRYYPKGILTGSTVADIAEAAEWGGDPQEFVAALIEAGGPGRAGFLDVVGDGYGLHNWKIRNRYAYFKPERSEQARRANDVRWSKRRKEKQDVNPDRIPDGTPDRNPERNPPSPPPPPPHLKERSKEDTAADAAGPAPPDQAGRGNGSDLGSPKSTTRRKKEYPREVLELWQYYCDRIVDRPDKKADALRNIMARINERVTVQQLGIAIENYFDVMPKDPALRYHPNNFFGQKAYFEGFLPEPEAEAGTGEGRGDE